MSGYAKLFSSIVRSTVWREPAHVRLVWVTMMALADRDGFVEASVPGLADCARVTLAECEDALEKFRSPDPYSRSKDLDGRRVVETDGGWVLVNFAKYRDRAYQDERKEKAAERMRELRLRNGSCSQQSEQLRTGANKCKRERTNANPPVSGSASASDPGGFPLDLPDMSGSRAREGGPQPEREEPGAGSASPQPLVLTQAEPKTDKKSRVKSVRATASKRVPTDWEPNEDHRRIAIEEGRDFQRELKQFRDCEFQKPHVDWNATFRIWLRSDLGRPPGWVRRAALHQAAVPGGYDVFNLPPKTKNPPEGPAT